MLAEVFFSRYILNFFKDGVVTSHVYSIRDIFRVLQADPSLLDLLGFYLCYPQ